MAGILSFLSSLRAHHQWWLAISGDLQSVVTCNQWWLAIAVDCNILSLLIWVEISLFSFCLASDEQISRKRFCYSELWQSHLSFIRPHAEWPYDQTTKRKRPICPVGSWEMEWGSKCDNVQQTKMKVPGDWEALIYQKGGSLDLFLSVLP